MKTHKELIENEAYQAWINDKTGSVRCPQGESTTDFHNRVTNGISTILEDHQKEENKGRKSIVVCHGGVISFIMESCFPADEKNLFQWLPDPGRGYTIHMTYGEPASYEEI